MPHSHIHPRTRPSLRLPPIAAFLPLAALLIASVLAVPGEAGAQTRSSSKIVIEGVPFSRYVLRIVPLSSFRREGRARDWLRMVERNLCYSGNFVAKNATFAYCRAPQERSDLQLQLGVDGNGAASELAYTVTDSDGIALFRAAHPIGAEPDEGRVMEAVNHISERLTGQPGILGSTLAFSYKQPGRNKVVARVDTHGNGLTGISRNEGISLLPSWDPKGAGLLYTILRQDGLEVVYDRLSGPVKSVAKFKGINSGGAWFADGKSVIVTLSKDGNADLYQIDMASGRAKRLTRHPGIDTRPSLSPDNEYLLFVSDRGGSEQVHMMRLKTREIFRMTYTGIRNTDPAWSPDGRMIAFTKTVARRDQIYVMDLYGENARALTSGPHHSEQPTWSPDGKQVAYSSNRTGDYKLYVVFMDGSGARRLTRTPDGFAESSPSWTLKRH